MLRIACRYHYRRDTAHYTSFLPEVNTGALLRKTLVLLIINTAAISLEMLSSERNIVSVLFSMITIITSFGRV